MHSVTRSAAGKYRRLERILRRRAEGIIISPLDDSLLAGPRLGLEDLRLKAIQIVKGRPDAVVAFSGLMTTCSDILVSTPTVLNVTASSTLGAHTRKVQVASALDALTLGCDGCVVHVNMGSKYESEMLSIMGRVKQDCDRYGLALIAHMYLRREGKNELDDNFDELKASEPDTYICKLAHACRVGVELGADIVKTQYGGTQGDIAKLVRATSPVPLVVAGGAPLPEEEALRRAQIAVQAGCAGVSFGRNVFSRDDSAEFLLKLRAAITYAKQQANSTS